MLTQWDAYVNSILHCVIGKLFVFKRSSVVSCTEKSIKKIGLDAINIANEEGLQAHALSIECRIKK